MGSGQRLKKKKKKKKSNNWIYFTLDTWSMNDNQCSRHDARQGGFWEMPAHFARIDGVLHIIFYPWLCTVYLVVCRYLASLGLTASM